MSKQAVSVRYESDGQEQRVDNPHFLLSDHGSSIFLGARTNDSSWSGISFLSLQDFKVTKTIHAFTPEVIPTRLEVADTCVTRSSESFQETFFMHDQLACYYTQGSSEVAVEVDVRLVDDYAVEGREHEATLLSTNPTVVRFSNSKGSFLLVSTASVTLENQWVKRATPYDNKRSGRPSWWVQRRAVIHAREGTRTVICPERRRIEAQHVLRTAHLWKRSQHAQGDAALVHAKSSLEGLLTKTPTGEASVLAGLPWFFQIYTRDEAIAVGGLLAQGKYYLASRILLREIAIILSDGLIPNRFPHSETGSADGVGWAFLRLREVFWRSRDTLRDEQWLFVRRQLVSSLTRLREQRVREGFVYNESQETWMDTTGGTSDTRSGARIEIQALTLNMIRFCAELYEYMQEDSSVYRDWEEELCSQVRAQFYNSQKHLLADGLGDWRVRPNVFIAYYAYDSLLSNAAWKEVFSNVVERLFLSWGAFASIDPSDELFCSEHLGEDDRSYHRGDAWYFLSNLAAVCLLRVSDDFLPVARSVYAAARRDLLWAGACGHCSEISGAARQDAFGCWSQTWSASTFIELAASLAHHR